MYVARQVLLVIWPLLPVIALLVLLPSAKGSDPGLLTDPTVVIFGLPALMTSVLCLVATVMLDWVPGGRVLRRSPVVLAATSVLWWVALVILNPYALLYVAALGLPQLGMACLLGMAVTYREGSD